MGWALAEPFSTSTENLHRMDVEEDSGYVLGETFGGLDDQTACCDDRCAAR
jgi:hypothetical protein